MNLALIGLGKMGSLYARDFISFGANLIGAKCLSDDSTALKVSNLNKKYNLKIKAFSNEKELFESSIDTVAICSPTETHLKYIKLAIQYNKNIICEKPFFWNKELSKKDSKNEAIDIFEKNKKNIFINLSNQYLAVEYVKIFQDIKKSSSKKFIFNFYTTGNKTNENVIIDTLPHFFAIFDTIFNYKSIKNIKKNVKKYTSYINFHADEIECELVLKHGEKKTFLEFGFDTFLVERVQRKNNSSIDTCLINSKTNIEYKTGNPLTLFLKQAYLNVEGNIIDNKNNNLFKQNFFRFLDIVYDK